MKQLEAPGKDFKFKHTHKKSPVSRTRPDTSALLPLFTFPKILSRFPNVEIAKWQRKWSEKWKLPLEFCLQFVNSS